MADNLWRPAGINNLWSNNLNWSLLAVPAVGDGNVVRFDGNVLSGPCTLSGGSKTCDAIDFTGETNTITFNSPLTVSGNVTLDSGMTIAGTNSLTINANSTLTSNGKTWPNALTATGAFTFTFADVWTISGIFTTGGGGTYTGSTPVVSGLTHGGGGGVININITVNGNISATGGTAYTGSGTVTVNNGTWSASGAGPLRYTKLKFTGTCTFSGTVRYDTGTLETTGATITTTGSTLMINASTVFDCSLTTFETIRTTGAMTITSTARIDATNLILGSGGNIVFSGTLGFTVANLSLAANLTTSRSYTWQAGGTYTVTTSVNFYGTKTARASWVSSTPTSSYSFILNSGGSCLMGYIDAVDADSSAGRVITDNGGTLLRTVNWNVINPNFFQFF